MSTRLEAEARKWVRVRFYAKSGDPRPVKWPPPGPFWCSGYSGNDGSAVVVAYLRNRRQLKKFWPDASSADYEECDAITFSERFSEPEWWAELQRKLGTEEERPCPR